ncbi:hypothetical protein [Marinitoga sp. 38H-ov]|uniref:hypothetical protein n=1 Tax=Marinitoga sp. 38H-ov TaxID=1755814 RepID=UPI0013EBE47C|nr:hypothetical protein [Marinitoga sp. 38H-ov]KAF2955536.1 hypothetical protein AS160_09665 [Marinitoga sp. 38H-ov]
MNEKNREIFEIISDYGSFAKPFLNLMILRTKKNNGWYHLFKSLEFSWKNEKRKALEEVEKGLIYKNTKTLKYLLLAKELYYLAYLRDYVNVKKNIYF